MKSLVCLVLGEGSILFVDIEESKYIGHLKEAILNKKKKYTFDADELRLFLAKKGGQWLKKADPEVRLLKDGQIPVGIAAIVKKEHELDPMDQIGDASFNFPSEGDGTPGELHVLVVLPSQTKALAAVSKLENASQIREECASIQTWEVGAVQHIPLICEFMEDVGGCTTNGKIFWRKEEQALASLILNGWFKPSTKCEKKLHATRSCILSGSPGVGKSTLLCLLAFVAALVYDKKVLVFRKLGREYSLLFLGSESGEVYFEKNCDCEVKEAVDKYRQLVARYKRANVWLLLDGFPYDETAQGMGRFKMLATSQQVDLKFQDMDYCEQYLHPCWRYDDLEQFGLLVHDWDIESMQKRFYCSGGSVREFARPDVEDIKKAIRKAVNGVKDASRLLDTATRIDTGSTQKDRLRRTFVNANTQKQLTDPSCWEQIVDSEYAVHLLSYRLRASNVIRLYHWAKRSGSQFASLAGLLFEHTIHCLASENALGLSYSVYDQQTPRAPHENRQSAFKPLDVVRGKAMRSGTKKKYAAEVTKWRDDPTYAYWFPACADFHNIDSIIKYRVPKPKAKPASIAVAPPVAAAVVVASPHLAVTKITPASSAVVTTTDVDGDVSMGDADAVATVATETAVTVAAAAGVDEDKYEIRFAYLQMTIAKKHSISAARLKEINKVVCPDASYKPLYILVCPSYKESVAATLETRKDVEESEQVCEICVGYYTQVGELVASGPNENVTDKGLWVKKSVPVNRKRPRTAGPANQHVDDEEDDEEEEYVDEDEDEDDNMVDA